MWCRFSIHESNTKAACLMSDNNLQLVFFFFLSFSWYLCYTHTINLLLRKAELAFAIFDDTISPDVCLRWSSEFEHDWTELDFTPPVPTLTLSDNQQDKNSDSSKGDSSSAVLIENHICGVNNESLRVPEVPIIARLTGCGGWMKMEGWVTEADVLDKLVLSYHRSSLGSVIECLREP